MKKITFDQSIKLVYYHDTNKLFLKGPLASVSVNLGSAFLAIDYKDFYERWNNHFLLSTVGSLNNLNIYLPHISHFPNQCTQYLPLKRDAYIYIDGRITRIKPLYDNSLYYDETLMSRQNIKLLQEYNKGLVTGHRKRLYQSGIWSVMSAVERSFDKQNKIDELKTKFYGLAHNRGFSFTGIKLIYLRLSPIKGGDVLFQNSKNLISNLYSLNKIVNLIKLLERKELVFKLGFTRPTIFTVPLNVKFKSRREGQFRSIELFSISLQLVTDRAAKLKSLRPADPYRLNGFRYRLRRSFGYRATDIRIKTPKRGR